VGVAAVFVERVILHAGSCCHRRSPGLDPVNRKVQRWRFVQGACEARWTPRGICSSEDRSAATK
jgi:hypothetical protein